MSSVSTQYPSLHVGLQGSSSESPSSRLETAKREDAYDVLTKYSNTNGASTVSDAASVLSQWGKLYQGAASSTGALARIHTISDAFSDGCTVVDTISDINDFRHSVRDFRAAASAADRAAQARRCAISGLTLVGDGCYSLNALSQVGLVAKHPAFMPVFYGSHVVTNTSHIAAEVQAIQGRLATKTLANVERVNEQNKLSFLKLIKNTTHLGMCLLGLVGIAFAAVKGMAVFPIAILSLTTIWVASRFAIYFQDQRLQQVHFKA
jgi:hypothetical protein